VAYDERIAVPAVAGQHHLEKHVLREQDPAGEAGVDQTDDGAGDLIVTRALNLLVGVEVVHADHVELEEDSTSGQRCLVVKVGMSRVHVAEDGMAEVAAVLLDEVEDLVAETEPAGQVNHERQTGRLLRPCRPRQRLALVGSELRGDADLADQADAYTGVADSRRRLGHDLLRDFVGGETGYLGRVR
jgi:hypothetical protein